MSNENTQNPEGSVDSPELADFLAKAGELTPEQLDEAVADTLTPLAVDLLIKNAGTETVYSITNNIADIYRKLGFTEAKVYSEVSIALTSALAQTSSSDDLSSKTDEIGESLKAVTQE